MKASSWVGGHAANQRKLNVLKKIQTERFHENKHKQANCSFLEQSNKFMFLAISISLLVTDPFNRLAISDKEKIYFFQVILSYVRFHCIFDDKNWSKQDDLNSSVAVRYLDSQ